MIPKKIHYCWFGGARLPSYVSSCIESWKRFCPDYEIICWDESNFDVSVHSFTKRAYEAKAWAFVSDYARLKVVYDHGGVYLDTDVELLRSLDPLLDNLCYMGIQQSDHLCSTGLGFGAVVKSSVVRNLLKKYDSIEFDASRTSEIACPSLNNEALEDMGYRYSDNIIRLESVTVYPCRFFDPIAPGHDSKNLLSSDTISIHHYGNSWGKKSSRLRRKLINLIGVTRIAELKRLIYG